MKFLKLFLLPGLIFFSNELIAQDSLDVTFRYTPNASALRAFVPGEFNNWGDNDGGQIKITDESLMQEDPGNGFWYKTIRLEIGGGTSGYQGKTGYAYKFHEQYNASGGEWEWFTDPLNPISIGDNNDSFLEITHPLIFQMEPADNAIYQNEVPELWANVAAKASDPINVQASQFFINDELVGNFEGVYEEERGFLSVGVSIAHGLEQRLNDGSNEFKIIAVTEAGATRVDSTQFNYLAAPDVVDEPRPAWLPDGITYSDATVGTVYFSLFAPGKDYVFVIGDFTDWAVEPEFQMKRDSVSPDSVWFWTEVTNLTPGQEYSFQYLVDGELRIADPYSELVLDPFNDTFIPESVYPNLKEYPQNQTTGYVGVIQPGKIAYDWEADDYERPEKENLVIYELLVRDFLADHSYNSLVDSLDYLERLGVNAIELMPVNEFDGNESWGYNPSFHLALDKYYGTEEAFKRFVDEAHKRGMAVILDVVLNHATGLSSLYRLYDDNNPYFNASPRHTYNVFNDFNHQYSGTQYYVKRVIEHWINEYRVDGFRWDLTKGFTQNCTSSNEGCTGSYQQDRVNVLKKYADYQWAADPDFIVIFEHLGTEAEEAQWANYRSDEGKGVMLWGNMNGQYNEATMGYGSNLYGVLSRSRSTFEKRHVVGYMESHDEQWLMFKNRNFGNSSGSYDITNLNTALGRQKLAGTFFFLLPGPKMMWEFGELGYGGGPGECLKRDGNGDCEASDPSRVGAKPIRWDYYNNPDTPERIKLYKTWSALINLRKSSPVFTNPESEAYTLLGNIKKVKLEHADTDVLILGNFGVTEASTSMEFTQTGTWYNFFEGTSISISKTEQSFTLAPGEFRIYSTREFETPETGIATSNEEEAVSDLPVRFELSQNYPNPFNPITNLRYDVPEASEVKLEVFDLVGRKVAELVNSYRTAGSYSVRFDAGNLGSGIYFYRLQAGGKVFTKKMTLIK